MEIRISFICLLFAVQGFGQVANDTVVLKKGSFVSRLLYNDSAKKHNHIVDLELFNYGHLGYNYFYSLNRRIRIGGRAGLWYFKTGQDLNAIQARKGFSYGIDALVNVALWKSIHLEFGIGYKGLGTWPAKTNTNPNGLQFYGDYLALNSGLNFTLLRHLFLRGALVNYYSIEGEFWNIFPVASIGYKF